MARRVRSGELTTDHARSGMSTFFAHARRGYHVTAVDGSVQGEAERIIFAHPLRAADALHVAGALAVDRNLRPDGESIEFVTADRRQAEAARAEGLDVRLVG